MAKKKKTQLKPVPRVFATTSVPKKVVEVEAAEEENAPATLPGDTQRVADGVQAFNAAPTREADNLLPEEQDTVDKYQEKVEKDIVRYVFMSFDHRTWVLSWHLFRTVKVSADFSRMCVATQALLSGHRTRQTLF